MDNLNIKRRQIYKDKNPTSILNYERRLPRGKRNHTIREKKQENQSLNHLQFTFNKYIEYSPKIELIFII